VAENTMARRKKDENTTQKTKYWATRSPLNSQREKPLKIPKG